MYKRMGSILIPILLVISKILELYMYAVFVWVILSWLVAFNVINSRNQVVSIIGRALDQIIEPVLRRIRRFIPPTGSMDLSPIALGFAVYLVQLYINFSIIPALAS